MCRQLWSVCFSLMNGSILMDWWCEQVCILYIKHRKTSQLTISSYTSKNTCSCALQNFSFVYCLKCHAAICGNSNESGKPMTSAFTWYKSNLTPAEFCTTTETPNIFPWFVWFCSTPCLLHSENMIVTYVRAVCLPEDQTAAADRFKAPTTDFSLGFQSVLFSSSS